MDSPKVSPSKVLTVTASTWMNNTVRKFPRAFPDENSFVPLRLQAIPVQRPPLLTSIAFTQRKG